MIKQMKSFLVLIFLWLFVWGCGDEGILINGLAPTAPSVSLDVGPVPEDIQEIIWGKDVDTLMAELEDAINGVRTDEEGRAVHDPTGIWAKYLIHKICLRREQETYYQKYISAGGVAIMGDKLLPDRAFYEARDIVFGMTQKRPELLALLTPSRENRPGAMRDGIQHDVTGRTTPSRKFRMILSNASLGNTVIPEIHAGNGSGFGYPIVSAGGIFARFAWVPTLPSDEIPSIFVAIFVHEFAHAIHLAIRLLDMTFDDRLDAAYAEAKENGSYFSSGNQALRNPSEYWAESAQRWFTVFSRKGQEFLHDSFRRQDPLMYELLTEWFDPIYLREVISSVYE